MIGLGEGAMLGTPAPGVVGAVGGGLKSTGLIGGIGAGGGGGSTGLIGGIGGGASTLII